MSSSPLPDPLPCGGRGSWILLVLACSACSDSPELTAWRLRRDSLRSEVAALRLVEADRAAAQSKWDALGPKFRALEAQLDVVATARATDAGVKAFQDGRGIALSFDGSLGECRDALRLLEPTRALTHDWRLRIDGQTCHWEGLETPAVRDFHRALTTPAAWKAPPRTWAFGLADVQKEVKSLEAEKLRLERALGLLGTLPEVEARLKFGTAMVAVLPQISRPCDLAVLERAVQHPDAGLLEVSSERFVHPLAPAADPRTLGLAELLGGSVQWSCGP